MSHSMKELNHPGHRGSRFWWCTACGSIREVMLRDAATLRTVGFGVPNVWAYRWRRAGGGWSKWRKVLTDLGAIQSETEEAAPPCAARRA